MAEKISEKPSETRMSARGARIYCTHNEHVTYEKKCIICGKTFTAKSEKAKVCSQKCQYQARKMRLKIQEAAKKVTPAQKKAIENAGGIGQVMQTPIGELTKGQKVLGAISGFLLLAILADEISRAKRLW